MGSDVTTKAVPSAKLIEDLLESLDKLFGGEHAGSRAVHAKGVMCSGVFHPSAEAKDLTRAPHAVQESTPVIVRFSNFAGIPTIADNDPNGAGPRGFAIRFHLGEHVHTDIIGHSHDGFPTRTGEEFLALARALAASGPDAAKPTPVEEFFAKHPKAKKFFDLPNPVPVSYATESYFGVNAFKFINAAGQARFGRFRIKPEGGNQYLSTEDGAAKSENFLADEIVERLRRGNINLRISVQMAEDGDDVNDSTIAWPNTRKEIDFGTVTLTERANDADPELRKIIFDPIPRVDGIEPSEDPLIDVRSAIYLLSGRRRRKAGQ